MYEICQLSGYEYVDTYATRKAEDVPTEVAHVASYAEVGPLEPRSASRVRCRRVRPAPRRATRSTARRQSVRRCGARRRVHRRCERRVGPPRRVHGRGRVPHAFAQAGEERGAERGRLLDRRAGARARRAGRLGTGTSRSITDAPPSIRSFGERRAARGRRSRRRRRRSGTPSPRRRRARCARGSCRA